MRIQSAFFLPLLLFSLTVPPTLSASAVSITRAFHRHGQTFLVWEELDPSQLGPDEGYHVYRSSEPITSANIGDLEPLKLNGVPMVVRQGSSRLLSCQQFFDPATFSPNLVPSEVFGFHTVLGWSVDEIEDSQFDTFAPEVPEGEGMLVWTPAAGEGWDGPGTYWYAVTPAGETTLGPNSAVSVEETADRLRSLRIWQSPTGKTRLYIQFMPLQRVDGVDWNPSLFGYAFFYSVEVPPDYDYTAPEVLPVYLAMHPGGNQSLPSSFESHTRLIRIMPNDRLITWWYGWNDTHDYTNNGGYRTRNEQGHCLMAPGYEPPQSGLTVNYMEQAVLRSLFDVMDRPDYSIDEDLVFIEGNSMGATGAFFHGLRYPNVFSTVFVEKGVVNPRNADETGVACNTVVEDPSDLCNQPIPLLDTQFVPLLGSVEDNFPIVNQSPWLGDSERPAAAAHLAEFDGLGIYDWMDAGAMLTGVRENAEGNPIAQVTPNFVGRPTAYFNLSTGYLDCAVSWDTQGRHLWRWLNTARAGFAGFAEDIFHTTDRFFQDEPWPEHLPTIPRYTSWEFVPDVGGSKWMNGFDYPRSQSFPALVWSDGVPVPIGREVPGPFEHCPNYEPDLPEPINPVFVNQNVRWRGEELTPMVDEEGLWGVTLVQQERVLIGPGSAIPDVTIEVFPLTVDITPRRTAQFKPEPDSTLYYKVEREGEIPDHGIVEWDNGLPVVPRVQIDDIPVRVEISTEPLVMGAFTTWWKHY